MIRSHVFVVNENTLPIHLSYQFVGVSSGEKDNNISLLADILRIKENDYIFFYIEGSETKKGRFFGIFKIKSDEVYYFKGEEAKNPNLSKKLIYRKLIEPYKVYSKGVLEWIALDKLPTYAKEIMWTLIYRKMKGKRGNTMLFPWEAEKLIDLIQEICINQNKFYSNIFGEDIVWLGNEVFAGSGMQKIDILTIEKKGDVEYIYRIIELKHPKSKTNIDFSPIQLEYYINWARDDIGGHIKGAKKFNIKPILLVLVEKFNSISKNVIDSIKNLEIISYQPEIWEMDFEGEVNKVL